MDMENTFNKVCREELRRVLDEYGVEDDLGGGEKGMYDECRTYVRWREK